MRELARQFDLPVFDKPDSQEICFVPDDDYAGLVERHGDEGFESGSIIDRAGATIGTHDGHQHFTVGQRRGVGVALGYPIYVVEKNAAANTVTVGTREDLLAGGCAAAETNWLCEPEPDTWTPCGAQIRYNAEPVPARVHATGPRRLEVRFDEPQFAVAPGQAVVCYDGDKVLGGGWITKARRHEGT